MNVKLLAAAVSIVSLSWLGLSFATPSELPLDPAREAISADGPVAVSAEHPDSHRLGLLPEEEVALPSWDAEVPEAGAVLALLTE